MCTDQSPDPDSLSAQVLDAVSEVSGVLGMGFLETVYHHALLHELALRGLRARSQASFAITYKDQCVGEYFADILVEDALVVELKCVESLSNQHLAQCLNYLRASGQSACLLVNFQAPGVEWRRIANPLVEAPVLPLDLTSNQQHPYS